MQDMGIDPAKKCARDTWLAELVRMVTERAGVIAE